MTQPIRSLNFYCRIILLAALSVICGSRKLFAQTNDSRIQCTYVDSLINNQFQSYVSATIQIKNTSNAAWKGRIVFEETDNIKVMGDKALDVNLSAGQSYFSPVRYFLTKMATAGDYHVHAEVYNSANQLVTTATLVLHVAAKTDIRVVPVNGAVTLPKKGDTLNVAAKISNMGNQPQKLNIVWSLPPELSAKAHVTNLLLNPYADTVVHLIVPVTKKMAALNMFRINIRGIFQTSGEIAAVSYIIVQKISSNKIYSIGDGSNLRVNSPNYVSFDVEGLGNSAAAYHLQSVWSGYTGPGKLKFEFNGYKWSSAQFGSQISNTYLDYQVKHVGATVGSIYENGEVNLNGIGAKIYTVDTLKNSTIVNNSAGWVNKNYNLAQLSHSTYSYGNSAWVETDRTSNSYIYTSQLAYDKDPFYNTEGVLWTNTYTKKVSSDFSYGGKFAAGNLWTIDSLPSRSKISLMGDIFLNANLGKNFTLFSDNYYSSPYYVGLRKGTQSFNERLTKAFNKETSIWYSFDYNAYRPQYLYVNDSINTLDYQSKITTSELGWSSVLDRIIKFSIIPSWYSENNNQFLSYGANGITKLNSLRMGTVWGLTIPGDFSGSVRFDFGNNTQIAGSNRYLFKSSVNANYKFLHIFALTQSGPQYLADLFYNYGDSTASSKKIYRSQFSVGGSQSFFHSAMNASLNCYYESETFYKNIMINGQLSYQANASRFWTSFQLMKNSGYRITQNVQIGFTYMLGASNPLTVNNKSSLFIKVNKISGKSDSSATPAMDYVVLVNKDMFVTDKSGNISYTKLPAGDYTIKCLPQSGWMAEDQIVHLDYKKTGNVIINLVQTSKLSGHVSITKDPIKAYPVSDDSSARTIMATDENGKQFFTKTDESGDYTFYLPEGNYTISAAQLPAEIETLTKPKQVTVSINHEISGIDFTLHIKSRDIETKHFGQ